MNDDLLKQYNDINWVSLLRMVCEDPSFEDEVIRLVGMRSDMDYLLEVYNNKKEYCSVGFEDRLFNMVSDFLKLVEDIKSDSSDPDMDQVINRIKGTETSIKDNLQKYFDSINPFGKKNNPEIEYSKKIKEVDKILKELEIKSKIIDKEILQKERIYYSQEFDDASTNNKKLAIFSVVLLFGIASVIGFIGFSFTDISLGQDMNLLNNFTAWFGDKSFLGRIIVLTTLFYLLNIVSRFFNAQMHQFTLNKHRHNAINSHKDLLDLAEDDAGNYKEVYNAMLSTLTSAIFNASDTGFVNNKNNSESKSPLIGQQIIDVTKDNS